MERLRMIRRSLVKKYIIVLVICGILLGLFMIFPYIAKSYKTWEELDFDANLNMVYVTDMTPDIVGPYYIEEGEEEDKVEFYYVYVDENRVMPIYVLEADMVQKAQAYIKAKEELQQGLITKDDLEKVKFSGIGRIENVSEYEHIEELQKYHQANTGKEIEVIPYSMQVYAKNDPLWSLGIMGGLALFSFLGAILAWLWGNTALGELNIVKYRKAQGDTSGLRRKINQFFDEQEMVTGIWLNREYIAGIYDGKTVFKEMKKVVWIYAEETNTVSADVAVSIAQMVANFPVNLHIQMENGKKHILGIQSMVEAQKVLDYIMTECRWIDVGYSEELWEKHKKR